MNLAEEISKLKKEKKAVILAHYYQRDEIQSVADYIGDSLALAQIAVGCDSDILVMCGVNFMGETAKILSPEKKVLIPDNTAGCSLADSCNAVDLKKFKEKIIEIFDSEYNHDNDYIPKWFNIVYEDVDGNSYFQTFELKEFDDRKYYSLEKIEDV